MTNDPLPTRHRTVFIPVTGGATLVGDLDLPHDDAAALVVFAHGSGSSRFSPRNRQVASHLQRTGLGTLLIDLLSEAEEEADRVSGHLRFDIGLLAERLVAVLDWLRIEPSTRDTRCGLFGASTGAGAALVAAARRQDAVHAVVSRGGRPDLAGHALAGVEAPTLLLVGGRDGPVIALNRAAFERLHCVKDLRIIPGAGHLFEEPGALAEVAAQATQWFQMHLAHAVH